MILRSTSIRCIHCQTGTLLATIALLLLIYSRSVPCTHKLAEEEDQIKQGYMATNDIQSKTHSRKIPLIFIGGVPRSGTTLLRAMLDSHPDIRCGPETKIVPRVIQLSLQWTKFRSERYKLKQAGVTKQVLNNAVAALCLEVILNHGYSAPRLCNKDPLMLISGTYTLEVFPNSKFLFMVRDGRATVHSIITRKVAIPGFDVTDYRRCLDSWNRLIERMYSQCQILGPEKCITIYYERLVTYTRQELERILQFLDLPWSETLLHHEEFINKTNGILLAPIEKSTDQVIKPVYLDALFNWMGQVPTSIVKNVAEIAPMLAILGYNPHDNGYSQFEYRRKEIIPTLPKQ